MPLIKMERDMRKTMNECQPTDYDSRVKRAIRFIEKKLDQPLSLKEVAVAAAISPHHFHRMFVDAVGMTVWRYIQGRRFKRACYQLAFHHDKSVTEVALDAQYSTPEAFSKAFKKAFGVSPTQFRRNPDFLFLSGSISTYKQRNQTMEVDIVNFKRTAIAVKEHNGPVDRLHETLQQFVAWRKASGPSPMVSRTFNIYYDDPELVAANNFRMDIGAELRATLKPNDFGIVKKAIPDLMCAVFRHHGSWDRLGSAMRQFYSGWLPESEYAAGDFPMFVHRINLHPQVAEADLLTDIYLPVKGPSAQQY